MPCPPRSTSARAWYRHTVIWLSLMLGAVAALPVLAAGPAWSPATVPDAEAEALVAAAGRGEVSSLEAALAGINDPHLAALARARIAAAQLNEAAALAHLGSVLNADDASPRQRRIALSIAAGAHFTAGDYPKAAESANALRAVLAQDGGDALGEAAGVEQLYAMASVLAGTPAQATVSFEPRAVALRRDKVGLPRSTMTVNGNDVDAVLDTGANLSVASASAAQRMGLRMLDGGASVGSSTNDAVATRLGVAEHLEFAGLELSNVVFLVLADEQLDWPVPGGYRIDAILGFPVMRALERFRFDAAGALIPEPAAGDADRDKPGNLHVVSSDMYVDVSIDGIDVPLLLDTGAVQSSLSARFAQRHPQAVAGLQREQQRVGGAGGVTERHSAVWPDVVVGMAGHQTALAGLSVVITEPAGVAARNMGLLGWDVLGAFAFFTVDLVRMRLEVGEPRDTTPQSVEESDADSESHPN